MKRRARPCSRCPFVPGRNPDASPEVMAAAAQRIADGEAWVCHQSCTGPQVTPVSVLCAGAPPPGTVLDG